MWHKTACPTCTEYRRKYLDVMREHLRAEQDLSRVVFDCSDGPAATEANQRAMSLLQQAEELRVKAEHHRLTEHGQRDAIDELLIPDNN